jgi:hypothetical protein
MPTYRNTRTGRVVDVPHEPTTRTHRPKRDRQWSDNLTKLDRSKRWERVEPGQADQSPSPKRPKAADVRAWAEAEGIDLPDRGRVPDEVVEQYQAAHDDG